MIYAEHSPVAGACGVGVVSDFSYSNLYRDQSITFGTKGGCGWVCAGFIHGDKLCDEAFEEMSTVYKLVFKTEPRINVNSDNLCYFAIFDVAGSGKPIGFDEFEKNDYL